MAQFGVFLMPYNTQELPQVACAGVSGSAIDCRYRLMPADLVRCPDDHNSDLMGPSVGI